MSTTQPRTMRLHVAAAVLVALASLAACGESAAPPSPAASADGSPTSAEFASIEDARDEYLRLLEPSGRSAQALSALLEDPNSEVESVQRSVDEYARETGQFASALQGRTWPDQVAGPIKELAAQLLAQVEPIKAAARGKSVEEVGMLLGKVPGATAAQQVRDAFKDAGA